MSLLIACALVGAFMQTPAGVAAATVSGRVVDEGSATPVAGVQVVLIPMRPGPVPPFVDRPRTAITNADGRYTFEGVEPGRYRVSAQKAGYALEPMQHQLPDFELAAGELHDAADVPLVRGGVIAGRVLDESGEPVVNVRVMAMRKTTVGTTLPRARANVLVPAGPGGETNDLGEFRLFSLAPGDYYVHAMPRPHFDGMPAPSGSTMVPTYFPGTTDVATAHPVTVAAGQTSTEIVFRMLSVPAFEVSGVVRDEAGRPVVNAVIRLDVSESTVPSPFMMSMWNQARTDGSGKFTISHVTNGAYTLLAITPVVIASPQSRGRAAGAGGRGFSFSSGSGVVGGTIGGGVLTETTSDGTTLEYRDDGATRVPVTIQDGNVSGLEVVVRRPGR